MSARPERRTQTGADLRRLIAAGNLLAAMVRGELQVSTDLADAWDSAVETLRLEPAAPNRAGQRRAS